VHPLRDARANDDDRVALLEELEVRLEREDPVRRPLVVEAEPLEHGRAPHGNPPEAEGDAPEVEHREPLGERRRAHGSAHVEERAPHAKSSFCERWTCLARRNSRAAFRSE
jgi:hypothetical protein